MSLSLLSLLVVEDDVPPSARAFLRKARFAPDAERSALLQAAAFALHREAHLDCDDARVLVGLED